MPHGNKVNPKLTKAIIRELYGKYPNWAIAHALGLKPQTIGVHAYKLGLKIGKGKLRMVKDKTIRKLLLEVVKARVEEIKKRLELEGEL